MSNVRIRVKAKRPEPNSEDSPVGDTLGQIAQAVVGLQVPPKAIEATDFEEWRPPLLRFEIGTRVSCYMGPEIDWMPGRVVALNYSTPSCWSTRTVPYQVWLHTGDLILAPQDTDEVIRLRPAPDPDSPPSPPVPDTLSLANYNGDDEDEDEDEDDYDDGDEDEDEDEEEDEDDYDDDEYDGDDNDEYAYDAPDDFSGIDKETLVRMGDGLGARKLLQEGASVLESYAAALNTTRENMARVFQQAPGDLPKRILLLTRPGELEDMGIRDDDGAPRPAVTETLAKELLATPARMAKKTGLTYHEIFFYPTRCEYEGCAVGASPESDVSNVKACSACKMVCYCSVEHQKADWISHKEECKVFQRNKLKAFFYRDEVMLVRYPLRSYSDGCDEARFRKRGYVEPTVGCEICSCNAGTKSMMRARCCENPICDTEDQYAMFSYSRAHCSRSHNRYTLCGHHGVEQECDRTVDWRECPGCLSALSKSRDRTADMLWRGLNAYNFCPLLSKDVPKHSLCETCSKCNGKFISGIEGCMFSGGGIQCTRCSGPLGF